MYCNDRYRPNCRLRCVIGGSHTNYHEQRNVKLNRRIHSTRIQHAGCSRRARPENGGMQSGTMAMMCPQNAPQSPCQSQTTHTVRSQTNEYGQQSPSRWRSAHTIAVCIHSSGHQLKETRFTIGIGTGTTRFLLQWRRKLRRGQHGRVHLEQQSPQKGRKRWWRVRRWQRCWWTRERRR